MNVCAVLDVIADAERQVTRTGQTSTSSVAIGNRSVPVPPNRAM